MKKYIAAFMALIMSNMQIAKAASTDTVSIQVEQPAPIEDRVVELHLTLADVPVSAATKAWRKQQKVSRHATCSGGIINPIGYIITAKHCAEGVEATEVVTHDQRHYVATLVGMSKTHDLAVIHIDCLTPNYFPLARDVQRGERIFILGSPLGITDTLSTGVIAKLDGDETLVDCGVLPGNSGGVVFNDNGELVGVATAGFVVMLGMTHLNLAQSLSAVAFFLYQTLGGR